MAPIMQSKTGRKGNSETFIASGYLGNHAVFFHFSKEQFCGGVGLLPKTRYQDGVQLEFLNQRFRRRFERRFDGIDSTEQSFQTLLLSCQ